MNATVFTDPAGRKELMTASASNKARLRTQLAEVNPFGSTDHLECAAHSASAAEQLGVAIGDPVELRRV